MFAPMCQRLLTRLALILALLLPATAAPAQMMTSLADIARVSVLPGWRTDAGTRMAGLKIELAEGWKTYWRSPGEAGIPPTLDLQGSDNLAGLRIHWPTPSLFTVSGLRSIGYKGTVVIPIELKPADPAAPIRLNGRLDLGVCADVCVPVSVPVAADLPPDGTEDPAIRASLDRRPVAAARAGLRAISCAVEPIADGLRLSARITLPRQGRDELAVFELPDKSIWISQAETRRRGDTLTASADLVPADGRPFLLNRSELLVTVIGDGRAVEITGCPAG